MIQPLISTCNNVSLLYLVSTTAYSFLTGEIKHFENSCEMKHVLVPAIEHGVPPAHIGCLCIELNSEHCVIKQGVNLLQLSLELTGSGSLVTNHHFEEGINFWAKALTGWGRCGGVCRLVPCLFSGKPWICRFPSTAGSITTSPNLRVWISCSEYLRHFGTAELTPDFLGLHQCSNFLPHPWAWSLYVWAPTYTENNCHCELYPRNSSLRGNSAERYVLLWQHLLDLYVDFAGGQGFGYKVWSDGVQRKFDDNKHWTSLPTERMYSS